MTASSHFLTEQLLTAQELAEVLGVHRETVYTLTHEGKVPGVKIGVVWRYSLAEVLAALEESTMRCAAR